MKLFWKSLALIKTEVFGGDVLCGILLVAPDFPAEMIFQIGQLPNLISLFFCLDAKEPKGQGLRTSLENYLKEKLQYQAARLLGSTPGISAYALSLFSIVLGSRPSGRGEMKLFWKPLTTF